MAKKIIKDEEIKDLTQPWGGTEADGTEWGMKKERVEEFLKKRLGMSAGHVRWQKQGDYFNLQGFNDKASADLYDSDPDTHAALLLFNEQLPITTVQGDSYNAFLYTSIGAISDVVVSGSKMIVPLRFSAVRTSAGDRINVGAQGTLTIQRSTNNGETWLTVSGPQITLVSTDYSDSDNYTSVDLGAYLAQGRQKVRIRAQFQYTDEDGTTKTASSAYVPIGNSVTKTQLSLAPMLNYQTPIQASIYQERGFPISYQVNGAVVKTLHVVITGGNGTDMSEITYPLTAADDSVTKSWNIQDATDTYKLFKHGVRTVKAWLTCDDGLGGTITSEVLTNRYMVVNPQTEEDKTKPYLMLQNVLTDADNYAQADICQYSVYSPTGDTVPVVFYLTAYAENFPDDNPLQYFRIEQNVESGTENTLNTTIEIESEDETQTQIPAYFRVFRKTAEGEVNFMLESQSQTNMVIEVDNSESYAPKAGADFVLNPKTRNNSEANAKTIINAKTGQVVESTWEGFGMVRDGWVTSEFDNQKVLRIPAGARLNFKYNPFAQFLTTPDSAMELELDFRVFNITNEADPIISLFENFAISNPDGSTSSTFRGLKMLPLKGNVYTKSKAVDTETDFQWREGVRTHVAINIHNAVTPNKGDVAVPSDSPTLDTKATKIALVRVFVNGDGEREFRYSITDADEFCTGAMSNGGFSIGQDGADIDIYSIRTYQNTAFEHIDVLNNRISTLSTSAEKQAARKQNDILTSGKVDIDKCKALGKRCIIWHGILPYKENVAKQRGWWEIFQYDAQGNYLPEYSGTVCKATKSLVATRQGSTANTYWDSNIQTKSQDVTETITVLLSDLHSSISYEVKEVDGNKVVALAGGNLGKNFPQTETPVDYPYAEVGGQPAVVVPDGWVDGNGKYRGIGYQVAEGTPMAQKLVNKINYASSMQSHLTGVNNLYNDLHTAIVGKNSLQQACSTARVSKYTEPFLFFNQADEPGAPILYKGPCTFGAGKMDKPTWGYIKKLHPNFFMLEGSDNNYHLTDMRVPFTWNQPNCSENITYSADDEGFFYNGLQCLDYDGGATEDDGTPKASIISIIQNTWNFLYLHSPMLKYFKGTFDAFQKSEQAKDTNAKYWCTDGADAYKLKRYDYVNSRWVDAGLWNGSAWGVVDLRTDEITALAYNASTNKSEYSALNVELRSAIVNHAKKYLGFYFRTDSLKLYYAFIIHLMCGTDSCSKNTYFICDPKGVNVTIDGETRLCYLLEMHSDDVDTVLPIDNNGRATKPYYIDRMHPFVDGDLSTNKYEGANNVLFNLCEQMWEGTKELQAMTRTIFTTMETLVKESDYIDGYTERNKVSVYGCLWKYIYYVQSYIPQVAYNEAARIRYEYPEMLGFVSYGSGARGVRPITQSNGSLLECELQFILRRLILMASYAAWGPFADGKSGNLGIAEATEAFSLQAFHLPGEAQSLNNYTYKVRPHQYLYPTGMMGQTVIDPHARIAPGEEFELNLGDTSSNDTGMSVNGINYYRSIGNVGDLSTTPANTITVNGKRLTEFVAEPTKYYQDGTAQTPAFRPAAIVVSAQNIKKISLKGCTGTTGNLDLRSQSRLETIDVRQTRLTSVSLPETNILTSVQLPATTQSVSVTNQENLSTLTFEGYGNLQSYIVTHNKLIDTFTHAIGMFNAKPASLAKVEIEDIDWTTQGRQANVDMLMFFVSLGAGLKGVIFMQPSASDKPFGLSDKIKVCALYGDIDSGDNDLYIRYDTRPINKISITGPSFMTEVGDYQFELVPSPVTGNNVAIKNGKLDIQWSLPATADPYAEWKDDTTGLLEVKAASDPTLDLKHIMTVTANTMAGSQLTAQKTVGFYRHTPKVGDFAYSDGSFDSEWDESRELVGQVFMRTPIYEEDGTTLKGYEVKVYAKEDLVLRPGDSTPTTWNTHQWGLYPDNSNGFLSAEQAIKDATGLLDPFDISTIPNIGNRWGDVNAYDDGLHAVPELVTDTVLADTPTGNYETYTDKWETYYSTMAALYQAICEVNSGYSYNAASMERKEVLFAIAQSGTISKANKEQLTYQGWRLVRQCYTDLTNAARSNNLLNSNEYEAFDTAVRAVADMLNNGIAYTVFSDERIAPSWCDAANYTYLNDASFLDDDRIDGYKVFPATCAGGDFDGRLKTDKIVAHAKLIVGDYLQEPWPTTMQELANAIDAIITANSSMSNPNRYAQFYYPAAYGCALYQPATEELNDIFKAGNWYCPAEGEVMRLYNFFRQGVTADKAEVGINEARTPIIANANAKAGRTVLTFSNNWYWSVSEGSRSYSWGVGFSSGGLGNYGKFGSGYVRPCTAFTFILLP